MADVLNLRTGGVCAVLGAVVFTTARLLHGDTPAAHAEAALDFVASRPTYAAVHLFAVFAAVLGVAGLVALVVSLTRPAASLLGRAGMASALVGLAVFAVESTSEGLALPELAGAAAQAAPDERADLVRAAQAVAAATHGPSLIGIALLYGIALALIGLAMVLEGYPSWLGWAGTAVGTVTLVAASGLFLSPALFPGALLYGLLASVVAQAWLLATGLTMLRRAAGAASAPR
ncbi:DUF4386 family protein [Dactylosporangium sp. NPDC049140]|uniref:DUF4386 family protein n=1 Tax=Dactylosporangium sp. NPDC049140 TaxID=3155647 RepID=UPI0033DCA463